MTTAEDFWTGSNNDNWTVTADWSPGSGSGHALPTSTQDAFIDYKGAGNATVISSAAETVNSIGTNLNSVLFITNDTAFTATNGTTTNSSDAGLVENGNIGQIAVADGSALVVDQGTFDNSGTLDLNSSGDATSFEILNSVTLNGGGTILMSPNSNNQLKGAGLSAGTLLNVDNTISGGGKIFLLNFTNEGTIRTNNTSGTGTLQIEGTAGNGSFTNTSTSTSAGLVQADNGGTLIFGLDSNSSTITNNGANIALDSTGNITKLEIAGNVTINGSATGTILLGGTGTGTDRILSDGNTASLTLTNQLLKGAGTVGDSHLTLNVQSGSTVDADISGQPLALSTGSNTIDNAGLMETLNGFGGAGGNLDLSSPVDNTGTILAVGGTVFVLAAITGVRRATNRRRRQPFHRHFDRGKCNLHGFRRRVDARQQQAQRRHRRSHHGRRCRRRH